MKLSLEQVRHVAKLSRLSLTAQEEEQYRGELQAVLDAFAALDALDLKDVPPTSQVNLSGAHLRKDVAVPPLGPEKALANAPDRVGTSFGVPKVIE